MKKTFFITLIKTIIPVGIIVILYFIFFNNKNKADDLPKILSKGKITVVVNGNFTEKQSDDPLLNFAEEIVRSYADSLNLKLNIVYEPDLQKAIKALKKNKYNIIAHFVPNTTQYSDELSFTIPIFETRQTLVQGQKVIDENNAFINDQNDLANDTICIPANSPHKMRIEHLSEEIAAPIYTIEMPDKTESDLLDMLAEGKIKYSLYPRIFSQFLNKKYPETDCSLNIGFNQNYSWAVHPDADELLLNLNEFLNHYIKTKAYWDLYRKYN